MGREKKQVFPCKNVLGDMMEYLRIENDFPRISHSAVTLGKFDGIHRGHQKLVEKIIEQKQEGAQAGGLGHTDMKGLKIRFPMLGKNNPPKGREMSYIGRNGSGYTVGMSAHRENTAHESREFYKRNTDRRSAGCLCGSWRGFPFWL